MARNVINRDLPFNEDAERVVLGSILLSKDALYKVLSALSEEDFYVGKHQLIFRAIVSVQIKRIDIDGIIDSYYVESFLEDKKIKFFKRVGNTEKPDIFCAKLLEGRVGILIDGSPIALTAPYVLFEDLQSSQDYYTIPAIASFSRIMRLFELFYSVLAPAIYVALQSFNYRILPINFLITLLSSIESLSIPPLIERYQSSSRVHMIA